MVYACRIHMNDKLFAIKKNTLWPEGYSQWHIRDTQRASLNHKPVSSGRDRLEAESAIFINNCFCNQFMILLGEDP